MRLALLISGGGSTAEHVFTASQDGTLSHVDVACVIASKKSAAGIARLARAGFPEEKIYVVNPKDYESGEKFGDALLEVLQKHDVDFVSQNGWLVKTPERVIEKYQGRIINQHPGPLDPGHTDFGGKGMFGMRVHAARLSFVKEINHDFWSEATVHHVSAEYDKGAVLGSIRVPIEEADTPEDLQKRMLSREHELVVQVLERCAADEAHEITRDERLVRLREEKTLEKAKKKAILDYPRG